MAILLVHGGLSEDMNADLLEVVSALCSLGNEAAQDRRARPRSRQQEVYYLASARPGEPVTVLKVISRLVGLAGCPEPPRPEFQPYLQSFARQVDLFASDLDAA